MRLTRICMGYDWKEQLDGFIELYVMQNWSYRWALWDNPQQQDTFGRVTAPSGNIYTIKDCDDNEEGRDAFALFNLLWNRYGDVFLGIDSVAEGLSEPPAFFSRTTRK